MDLTIFQISLLMIFGIFIGIIGSVLGVGGGIFIVPFLLLVFKLPIKSAIAVSLVSIIATSSSVASTNVEKGLANVRLGVFLEIATAAGSIAGSLLMLKIPSDFLQIFFAFMLIPSALSMYIKAKKPSMEEIPLDSDEDFSFSYYDSSLKRKVKYKPKKTKIAFLFSAIAGMLSGLLGIGGGIIVVPVMNIICGIPMKVATSTSNFMLGLTGCVSAIILFKNGYVVENIAVFLIIGVIVGGIIGMKFLSRTKNSTVQIIFSILMMGISIEMIWRTFSR